MEIVIANYKHVFGDDWEDMLVKNGRCLFMTTKLRDDGKFQLWHFRPEEMKNSWYDPAAAAIVRLEG